MTRTALRGVAETAPIDMFRPGTWFDPFGIQPMQLVEPSQFQPLIQRAGPAVSAGANRIFRRFPLAPDEPQGVLLVAPAPRAGVAVLLQEEKGNLQLLSLWPFVSEGAECEIKIRRVLLSPNRLEAMVEGTLPGGGIVTWHDVFFAEDRVFYAVGSVHSVALSGFMHGVLPAQTDPVTIAPDNPAWSAVRERMPDMFEADGSATIRLAGMAALLSSDPQHPEWHIVQGPVKKVEPYALDLFGRKTWVVTATVARGGDRSDLDLPLFVSDAVVKEVDLPRPGDDFAAVIRLTGRLWNPNVRLHDGG